MLEMEYSQEIIDAIHGSITYSGIEREIIGSPFFNRLHRILQSSLVYLTYPSNKVKRFEHSIGTMHLAGLFFFHSVCNTAPIVLDQFFDEINAELKAWNAKVKVHDIHYIHKTVRHQYANDKILEAPCPINLLYAQYTPSGLKPDHRFAYYVVYQSIRLVGMLHDVGHLPYSHILEHAVKLLYQKVKQLPEERINDAHRHFLRIMEKYCANNGFEIHEELGKKLVGKIFESIIEELPQSECAEHYFLAAVLYFTHRILNSEEDETKGENTIFSDLHRIVAGTIDCDRMDYCCRDAYFAGISKELLGYNRIFTTVKIIYREPDKPMDPDAEPSSERAHCFFSPSTKAVNQIEDLLERRWNIFATVNYHHRVHKHELLLERVLAQLGMQELEDGEVPKQLENVLPLQLSSIWKLVEQMDAAAPIEYLAIQLDDSWLDTLLKHKYFEAYGANYLSLEAHVQDIDWYRFDELISAKKRYHSLIKRSGGFRKFDECFYNSLVACGQEEAFHLPGEGEYIKFLKGGEYAFNKALRTVVSGNEARARFFGELEENAKRLALEHPEYHIIDCFVGDCAFKLGVKWSEPLYISSPEQDEKKLWHYSSIYHILNSKRNLLPCFHAYFLPEYDTSNGRYKDVDTKGFQNELAQFAATLIIDWKDRKP